MSFDTNATAAEASRNLVLWAGLLGGPVAWFSQLTAGYALAEWACRGHGRWPIHLSALAGLALTAAGIVAAWRSWQAHGGGWPSSADEGEAARSRFMGLLGLLAGPLFALIILAQWLAGVVLAPCPLGTP